MQKTPGLDAIETALPRRKLWSYAVAALSLAAIFAVLAISPAHAANGCGPGAALTTLPFSSFQGADGDQCDVTGSPGSYDWQQIVTGGGFGSAGGTVQNDDNDAVVPSTFKAGSKEEEPNGWEFKSGTPAASTNLLAAWGYPDTQPNHLFMYVAFARQFTGNAANHMSFELNQNASSETFTTSHAVTTIRRRKGDLLLAFDRNGSSTTIRMCRWLPSDPAPASEHLGGTWSGCTDVTASGSAQAGANDGFAITNFLGGGSLAPGQFGEVAIDLTTALKLGSPDGAPCADFSSLWMRSRQSGEVNADPVDFIEPTTIRLHNCGRVIVKKKLGGVMDDDLKRFEFSADFDPLAGATREAPNAFGLAASETQTIVNVQPGSYSLKQSDPADLGYDLSRLTCVESGALTNTATTTSVPDRTATLHVDPGEKIECTYDNMRRGGLWVEKRTEPAGDPTSFAFTTDAPGGDFSLKHGERNLRHIAPGRYTLTEAPTPGWELVSVTCTEFAGDDPIEKSTRISSTVQAVVQSGQTKRCIFVNKKSTRLIVKKRTLPAGDSASFGFETSSLGAFSLSDGATREFGAVTPGDYTVTENATAGWGLTGLSCDDADSTVDSPTRTATARISKYETVTCTFTNSKDGMLVVKAQTLPDDDPTQFDYTTSAPGAPAFKLAGGASESRAVAPGAYTATQADEDESRLDGVVCGDANSTGDLATRTATFNIDPGEMVTCTFLNRTSVGAIAVKSAGVEYAYPGDKLALTFTVTSSGTSPLTDVQVADDACTPVVVKEKWGQDGPDETPEVLEPSDTWVYECTMLIAADPNKRKDPASSPPLLNTVTVDAEDEFERSVSARASHATRILHPAIQIDTRGPATAVAGEPVGYTFDVTNPGDTPFLSTDVSVGDALCEAPPLLTSKNEDATASQHDPGDTWTYTCTVRTQSDQTEVDNVGKVTAKDSFGGREVTDTDPATTQLTQPVPLTPRIAAAPPAGPTVTKSVPRIGVPPAPASGAPTGTAKLRGPSGCLSRPFRVTVTGQGIARVDFLLDGKRYRRITARAGRTVFSIRIDPRRQSRVAHRVSAKVTFHSSANTVVRTLRLVYVSCAPGAIPRFAG